MDAKKYYTEQNGIKFGYWACRRPMTKKWGSGQIYTRICEYFECPDIVFGKTDNIPNEIFYVDHNNGYEWKDLPFDDNQYKFGYWDPPYDKLYKKEGQEIWRTVEQLAILHTHIYPKSWFPNAIRVGMFSVTFGPLKQIRCLQVFKKYIIAELPL